MSVKQYVTQFEKEFIDLSKKYGGWINYHTHPDRTFIYDKDYAKLSLKQKQNLIETIHKNKNYKEGLNKRLIKLMDIMYSLNTKKVYGFIDVAPSCGLDTIKKALQVKKQFKNKIDFQVGAYPVSGLENLKDKKWKIFLEATKIADFIGGLPEKDDKKGCFGSFEHMKNLLKLAIELKKEVHVHVDQKNHPEERMTEMLVEAVKEVGSPKIKSNNPTIWAVHSISPSCYNKKRLQKLIDNLKKYKIGVVCCPAAVSYLQLENSKAPIHNCTAPILKLLANDVAIRFGSDNIEDYYAPSGTPDLSKEISYLAHLVRFYNVDMWARLCCGMPITKNQKKEIKYYLKACEKSMEQAVLDIKYQNKIN